MDTLPSGATASGGCRSALAVSSFRLRARLGFSIPSTLPGRRGITPAFGYDAPHLSVGGTLTLLNNALLSAHYGPFRRPLLFGRLPGFAGYTDYLLRRFHDGRRRASPVAQRVLATVPPLPPRRSRVSVFASLRPSMLSSPWGEGFGLRDFHFSGLPVRSLTLRPGDSQSSFRRLCRWASGHWFPSSLPSKLQGCWLFALVGLPPTERASLRWTHHPTEGSPGSSGESGVGSRDQSSVDRRAAWTSSASRLGRRTASGSPSPA
jgi:hypothetical protein